MKLKEIKPNMAIHCKNEEEFKELRKHCKDPLPINYYSSPIDKYVFFINNEGTMLWDLHGICKRENIIFVEFSDLVIPESKFKVGDIIKCRDTEELNQFYEILAINDDGYIYARNRNNSRYFTVADIYPRTFNDDEMELSSEEELTVEEAVEWLTSGKVFVNSTTEEIINQIKQYKKDHATPKEPEIEWVWILDCTWLPRQYFNSEEEAIKRCEGLAKKHTSKEFTYKKICRVKN